MVVSRSRIIAPSYRNLALGLRILGVTLDSKLTFETHLRELVSKAARRLGVVH